MTGTTLGGKKVAQRNLAKDPDFYRKIGAIGGSRTGIIKGFAFDPEKAAIAGQKGGRISRRRPKIVI
jgi:general stress protein YciG